MPSDVELMGHTQMTSHQKWNAVSEINCKLLGNFLEKVREIYQRHTHRYKFFFESITLHMHLGLKVSLKPI